MIETLFEDEHYIIVNKPPNLLVHRSRESAERDNLLKQVRNQIDQYVYPVHRLDRQVSGALIFSKTPEALTNLQKNWHDESFSKKYIGLARGIFDSPGKFDFPLNNEKKVPKEALTLYRPLKIYHNSTLLLIEIKTGRHHQIRRHFARRVQHLLGDRKYGKKKYNDEYLENYALTRLFLHSCNLKFTHPYTSQVIDIKANLWEDLEKTLKLLSKELVETIENSDYI